MINITLPDGAVREYENGTTALEVALSISEGLARNVLGAKINGELWDATRPINADSNLQLLTWNDLQGKETMWHSSAHLMAEALEFLYPGVKFGIGPPIETGFYYDIDLGEKLFPQMILLKLKRKLSSLHKRKMFLRKEVSKSDAISYFKEKGDEYKLDLLEGLEDGKITFYTQGQFTDLCRGPHIPNTGFIKAVKLLSLAGAYWRGDETKTTDSNLRCYFSKAKRA